MTQRELIEILRRHPRACGRLGLRIEIASTVADEWQVREIWTDRLCASSLWPKALHPIHFAIFIGPLVVWAWSKGIEAVRTPDGWQAYPIGDGNTPLSGLHPEPWLALLDACEKAGDE